MAAPEKFAGSMKVAPTFAVAVLAGGSSRRMGRDKALLEIDGDAMVLRVVAAARASDAQETVVVGREPDLWPNVSSIPDRFPGEGPLGGLVTALGHCGTDLVVLMPCDLLYPSGAAVQIVVDELGSRPEVDVLVPLVRNRRQYVQAGFRRAALEHLEARFEAGSRSIHDGIVDLVVEEVPVDEADWFADADEPADLPVRSSQEDFRRTTLNSVPEQSIDELASALADGAPLLDVREVNEWLDERIEGGLHIPLGDVPDHVPEILAHIESAGGGDLWVVCASGGRSMTAADFLSSHGISAINVAGGTKAWVASGNPFATGPAE